MEIFDLTRRFRLRPLFQQVDLLGFNVLVMEVHLILSVMLPAKGVEVFQSQPEVLLHHLDVSLEAVDLCDDGLEI